MGRRRQSAWSVWTWALLLTLPGVVAPGNPTGPPPLPSHASTPSATNRANSGFATSLASSAGTSPITNDLRRAARKVRAAPRGLSSRGTADVMTPLRFASQVFENATLRCVDFRILRDGKTHGNGCASALRLLPCSDPSRPLVAIHRTFPACVSLSFTDAYMACVSASQVRPPRH